MERRIHELCGLNIAFPSVQNAPFGSMPNWRSSRYDKGIGLLPGSLHGSQSATPTQVWWKPKTSAVSPRRELKKLKPVRKNNAKELELFADVLQRAAITLKENGRESDLEGGTLHTIILEKIPERLLTQYYRWLREKQYEESLGTLKNWVSEEAEYQIGSAT